MSQVCLLIAEREMAKRRGVILLFLWAGPKIYAQQAEEIRQQLEQLKQEYQAKIRDLEQRIAALENQTKQQKEVSGKPKEGTVSAAELAAEQVAHKAVVESQNRSG